MKKPPTRQRRNAGSVVTEEAIQAERVRFQRHLRMLESEAPNRSYPPGLSRDDILRSGALRAGLSALVYLRTAEPKIYRQLVSAALEYTQSKLSTGQASYEVKPWGRNRFWDLALRVSLLAIYDHLLAELNLAWKAPIRDGPVLPKHFVSKTGRYGEAQARATARRKALIRNRTAAVLAVAESVVKDAPPEAKLPRIDDRLASDWVVRLKTPGLVSKQIVAHFVRRSLRTVKKYLNEARKQDALARRYLGRESATR